MSIRGTLTSRSGDTPEILERRSVDICWVQETTFREKSWNDFRLAPLGKIFCQIITYIM